MMIKKVSGKPSPPVSKAVIGSMPVVHLNGINPQRVPASAYVKKQGK